MTEAHIDHEQCFNLIPRKPWGRAVFLGGGGAGFFIFFLSKTVAMLIKLLLFSKTLVCYTAVFSVFTQRSSPLTAAENRTTFLSRD